MSDVVLPLHMRGRRPPARYVAQPPCQHRFGEPTTLEAISNQPPQAFAGRLRFKNEARVCDWCGLVMAVMR